LSLKKLEKARSRNGGGKYVLVISLEVIVTRNTVGISVETPLVEAVATSETNE